MKHTRHPIGSTADGLTLWPLEGDEVALTCVVKARHATSPPLRARGERAEAIVVGQGHLATLSVILKGLLVNPTHRVARRATADTKPGARQRPTLAVVSVRLAMRPGLTHDDR